LYVVQVTRTDPAYLLQHVRGAVGTHANNSFAGFLTNFIGFFIPMYFSLAALETPQPQDDVQWCVFAA